MIFPGRCPTASSSAILVEPYLVDDDFPESTIGMLFIKPKTLAQDLIVLDRNLFNVPAETTSDTHVQATWLEGKQGFSHSREPPQWSGPEPGICPHSDKALQWYLSEVENNSYGF